MEPTTKLVKGMVKMQACYINTTHPDFLNGQKAMQIISERLNASKPPPPAHDPKQPMTPAQINDGKEEQGFFGRFLAAKQVRKRGGPVMEAPPHVIKAQAAPNDRELMETEVIKLLIQSYFNIIKREMIDMVPKAITLTLVNHSKENLQRELLQELYKPEILDDLLKESEYIVSRRKEVISMVGALNKAEEIIASV